MAAQPPDYNNIRMGGPSGLRIPQEAGKATFAIEKEVDINVGGTGTTNNVNLTADQCLGSAYVITNGGSGATTITWPGNFPGHRFSAYNHTGQGQACTFKISGKTGVAVADGKRALLVMESALGDIARLSADI